MIISCSSDKKYSNKRYSNNMKIYYQMNKPKYRIFVINNEAYKIYKASDEHEYYLLELGMGGQLSGDMPFHYPGCKKCFK